MPPEEVWLRPGTAWAPCRIPAAASISLPLTPGIDFYFRAMPFLGSFASALEPVAEDGGEVAASPSPPPGPAVLPAVCQALPGGLWAQPSLGSRVHLGGGKPAATLTKPRVGFPWNQPAGELSYHGCISTKTAGFSLHCQKPKPELKPARFSQILFPRQATPKTLCGRPVRTPAPPPLRAGKTCPSTEVKGRVRKACLPLSCRTMKIL